MLANPDISIEIQGHVNGPGEKNKKKYKALSKERAQAVFLELWEGGIDRSRMKYTGYGNSAMVFKAPINERQAEQNRRVEVQIL